jgi:hypothetical protein
MGKRTGKMAEYHVGCGIAGIYAGVLKKNSDEWLHKSLVTKEVIDAVIGHMYFKIPDGERDFAYVGRMRGGEYVRLKIEISDEFPEWMEVKNERS